MIALPSSWIATSAGAFLGLSLGIPGALLGVLAGRLLDSVLADIRARSVIFSLLSGASPPPMTCSRLERLFCPLRSARVRDARAVGYGRGGEEYVLLISLAVESHRGSTAGVEPPEELCDAIGDYLEQRCTVNVRGLRRFCLLVYRASRRVSTSERLRLLKLYAGDRDRANHMAFLRSLITDSPASEGVVPPDASWVSSISEAKVDVPISPRLAWDEHASGLLGLDDFASEAEVRTAFREKARLLHPDVHGDDRDFIRLREAYETLLSRFGAQSGGQAPEDGHRDPHNRARSDTRY